MMNSVDGKPVTSKTSLCETPLWKFDEEGGYVLEDDFEILLISVSINCPSTATVHLFYTPVPLKNIYSPPRVVSCFTNKPKTLQPLCSFL